MDVRQLFFALLAAGFFAVLGTIALTGLSRQTKRAVGSF